MAATPSIRIIKTFTYRGQPRTFSNRYHFNGGTPASDAAWHTLMDNVTAAEKAIYPSNVTIIGAVGYAAGSDVPVSNKTYSLAGTFAPGTNQQAPGDAAGLIRFSTAVRTSKNHPLYLFNYFHGVVHNSPPNEDQVQTSQLAAYGTYGSAWISGFSDGTTTYNRAGPNGANATGVLAETYITHRDFPR